MASTRGDGVYVPESFDLGTEDITKLGENLKEIKKAGQGKAGPRSSKGVIYLGHIPKGFYEPQMKQFFSQFGRVSRVRLSRSKKTGNSKGYAFIEFEHDEVAKIVAETMNNYLMFMRLLKCELLPPEKVHPDMFKGCNKKFAAPKSAAVAAKRHNSRQTEQRKKRSRGRQKKQLKKMVDLGIATEVEKVAQSPVPEAVNTPRGKLQVLKEDPSDAEVTFKTPPGAVKSSRLPASATLKKKKTSVKKRVKRLKYCC